MMREAKSIDWRAFFAGAWRLSRWIDDRRGERFGAASGDAIFADGPTPGSATCDETLVIDYGGRRIDGASRLIWRFEDCAGPDLFFSDGRLFCAMRFHRNASGWRAAFTHECGADSYDGVALIDDANCWRLIWTVSGPRKDYTLDTRYARIVDV
jgi:hypothetical protein